MKIHFTICNANYLPFAKTLADSFIQHNSDYTFFIILADRLGKSFSRNSFDPYRIIEAEELGIEDFASLWVKYKSYEIVWFLKPYVTRYLFEEYNPDIIIFSDTDIFYYRSVIEVEKKLLNYDILLTPHIVSPEPQLFYEPLLRRSGLYNGGFFAVRNTENVNRFLKWWASRLVDYCYYEEFSDQLWLNFVPLFFDKVLVDEDPGMNVAIWNLYERDLIKTSSGIIVNNAHELIFLHYHGMKPAKNATEITNSNDSRWLKYPVFVELVNSIIPIVRSNGYDEFINKKCYYSNFYRKDGMLERFNKTIKPLKIRIDRT